jgi:DNA polymerase-3 subunit epsilon
MLILGLDFETTFLSPVDVSKLRITEIGAVLYDWDTKKPLEIMSKLIYSDEYPKSPPELVELTGITDEMLDLYGEIPPPQLRELNCLMAQADYVVAHNGNGFDKPIYEAECLRHNIVRVEKPWIDTRVDIQYPANIKSRKLTYLAAEHGFANPFQHRALFDVLTMMHILEKYDLDKVIALSKEDSYIVTANVSFQNKDKAKGRGYFWNAPDKLWQKEVKESTLDDEKNHGEFNVQYRRVNDGI